MNRVGDMPRLAGLSEQEATAALRTEGYNELPSARKRSLIALASRILAEPMILLLVGIAATYFLLGDPKQAVLLLASVLVIIGIDLYQEGRTEQALERLRDLSSPRALVIRDGAQRRVPGREVVTGDVVILSEGDRVPADGVLLWAVNVSTDESLLTGESLPVRKVATMSEAPARRPGGDDLPFVYSGTLITSGKAVARITSTGTRTEIGKIGRALQSIEPETGPLHRETGRIVRVFAVAGIVVCAVVAAAYAITRGDWLNGALAGLTLAVSMTPEEFPVVLTVFLTMGAWRMSRRHVLARRVPTIESLGTATVLCADKTGTITQNRMSVARLWTSDTFLDLDSENPTSLPEKFHELVEFAVLASQRDPSDPMERAFTRFAGERLANTEHLHADWTLVREYPLLPELLALSHVWTSPDATRYAIAAKGAPEAIADLCHLREPALSVIGAATVAMAEEGLRVLGVARAYFGDVALPSQQHDFDFEFLGLIAVADPIRPTVPAAIQECYAAGIEVVMITGDHPGTARHIARGAGLRPRETVLIGLDLERLTDRTLSEQIGRVNVFARMIPEQKLRLVRALQAKGEIVAMTGDGVNDAPALKAAHIGIAMGERGTDVAREAAALVLIDDDFGSIVTAIRMGRRIYDNLRKAMGFVIAVHIPIAGIALIPLLVGWPMVLLPVHIVFLELLIDPACSIAFEAEAEEPDVMRRPPRRGGEHLFSRRLVTTSVAQGVSVLVGALAVFAFAAHQQLDETVARGLSFATLIAGSLALIFTNRSWAHGVTGVLRTANVALWIVVVGSTAMLLSVLYIPPVSELFRFGQPRVPALVLAVAAGVGSALCVELYKRPKVVQPTHVAKAEGPSVTRRADRAHVRPR